MVASALPFLQALTMVAVVALTYLLYRAFGDRRTSLLFSREEKLAWDKLTTRSLGSWLTRANIAATLTSLATVYIFFIGSSKLFGAWIFLCALTIFAGAWVTNWATERIARYSPLLHQATLPDQTGAVIARVVWDASDEGKTSARWVRAISISNLAAIVWLEFALFSDISGQLLGLPSIEHRFLIFSAIGFSVLYFTFRYGLRGFVFGDFFHFPVVVIGTVILLVGCILLIAHDGTSSLPALSILIKPILPLSNCIVFAVHVAFLNTLLVLVTEAHWMRVWIFGEKETRLQVQSLGWTALVWTALIAIGLLGHTITGTIGEESVIVLLTRLAEVSPIFLVAFWLAGVAALFSTADSQVYSLLLVREFDPATGQLRDRLFTTIRPAILAAVAAVAMGLLYLLVRRLGLPFEKIIFAVIPLSLNVLPAIALKAFNLPPRPNALRASVAFYIVSVVAGFLQSSVEYLWTLSAAVVPVVVTAIAIASARGARQ